MGSILDLQDDHPNLQSLDFSVDVHCTLKDGHFLCGDGIESVFGLSWAPLGCSWGSRGRPLGAPDRPKGG